jgi:nanoRNase/pAp phosphatase (c-di-AMP/oligoRNAs hydrolase)
MRLGAARAVGSSTSRKCYFDVRLDVGSSSTLVLGYLLAAGMIPDKRLATALFVGVMTDTDSLLRDAEASDIAAYTRLLPLADMQLVYGICRPPLGRDYFRFLASAMNKAVLHGHCLIADCGEIAAPDAISTVSDFLIRNKGILYALAHGSREGRLYLSLRAKLPREDATRIMLDVVGPDGKGGGHNLSAGGFIDPADGKPVSVEAMRRRFLQAAGAAGSVREPLL